MGSLEFKWTAEFTADKPIEGDLGPSLLIRGTFIDTSTNKNKWAVDPSELESISQQIAGSQLRIDHGGSVRDIVGGFTKGILVKESNRIDFEAEVDDPDVIRKVLKKRVNFVSPGLTADAFCSECGKPTRPFRECSCKDSYEIIKNCQVKEGSIISSPAFKSTKFKPIGFMGSVDNALSQDNKVISGELSATEEENKLEEKREMTKEQKEAKETKTEEKEVDIVAVLTEKFDAFASKLEEISKKLDAKAEVKEEPKKEEPKKEEKKEEPSEKDEIKKLMEQVLEALNKKEEKPKEEEKPKDKEPDEDEDEDEDEEKKKKEESGAMVDTSQDTETSEASVTGDEKPAWWREVEAAAKKHGIV